MTWFELVKSSEMKEFEMLAEKYAKRYVSFRLS